MGYVFLLKVCTDEFDKTYLLFERNVIGYENRATPNIAVPFFQII
jgi:hypothetical protein